MAATPISSSAPAAGPVLRYDGACAFCRHEAHRLERLAGGKVRIEPLQSAVHDTAVPDEIKLAFPDGRTYGGAEAVFRALGLRPLWRPLFWLYLIPGLRQTANAAYRCVAANRYRLSAVGCADGVCAHHFQDGLAGPSAAGPLLAYPRPTFRRSTKLFLTALGCLHLAAFAGLYPQILSLMGREGLMPLAQVLDNVRANQPEHPYRTFPTLFWLSSSDATLRAGCGIGVVLALGVIAGIFRRTALLLLGALYISYSVGGTSFFQFQWDNLLIETTLHALLLPAYSRAWFRRGTAPAAQLRVPHASAVFLMHWLLFRVYFESGLAKIQVPAGGWRDFTAMNAYYDTAPLATWLGWYAHNLPTWWHEWETGLTLLVEILLPVFIFTSRRWRRPLFVVFTGFQLAILLTANYGLFNYNTLALGLFLLEDRDYEPFVRFGHWFRRRRHTSAGPVSDAVYAPGALGAALRSAVLFAGTAAIVAASLLEFFFLVSYLKPRSALREWTDGYRNLRLVNSYHLFASMTRERLVPEIQGLDDRGEWVPYRWRFAPADPADRPRFAAPYHPRLDFQIWFVTLSGPLEQRHPFFPRLMTLVSQHPERAAEFFADDPFADRIPPRMLRAMLFRYRMTDPDTRARTGDWWQREPAGRLTRDIPCAGRPPATQPATQPAVP